MGLLYCFGDIKTEFPLKWNHIMRMFKNNNESKFSQPNLHQAQHYAQNILYNVGGHTLISVNNIIHWKKIEVFPEHHPCPQYYRHSHLKKKINKRGITWLCRNIQKEFWKVTFLLSYLFKHLLSPSPQVSLQPSISNRDNDTDLSVVYVRKLM